MLYIGCHLSSSKGYLAMGREAEKIGANTFQFFTRNPRGGKAKDIDPLDAAALETLMQKSSFGTLVAHAPYTLNACAEKPEIRAFAKLAMTDDLLRMEYTPHSYYNFHPGSHVGQGTDYGIEAIAALLNELLKPEQTTMVLLETMSGQGSEVGGTFEQLAEIISRVELQDKIGVCLDTCHVYAAGYDIVNDADAVLDRFDHTIGLNRLRAIHLNDSIQPLGSHKDRHARIGEGTIGADALVRFVNTPPIMELPLILETPNEAEGYAKEIAFFRTNCI